MDIKMEKPESTKGMVLISNSSIVTDFFYKTVVFMVDHDKTGAFGIILNKKSDSKIGDIIKNMPDVPSAENPVWIGGPVDSMFVCIVHDTPDAPDTGFEIMPGIFMGRSYDLLTFLAKNNLNYRIYQGYSGWGPGQLESEFDRFSWVIHKPTPDMIFNQLDQEEVWKNALVSKGGIYKYFVEHTKDPLLN